MHTFYVKGKQVKRAVAYAHWLASATYRDARKNSRRSIWSIAVDGDVNGNHDPHGEVRHLLEAGIELR